MHRSKQAPGQQDILTRESLPCTVRISNLRRHIFLEVFMEVALLGFLALCGLVILVSAANQQVKKDTLSAQLLEERLEPLYPYIVLPLVDPIYDFLDHGWLRVGEVTRHFDTNTS